MGEPQLMTKKQYFQAWQMYNKDAQSYCRILEELVIIMFILGSNGAFAANAYGTGHSGYGPRAMIAFMVLFVVTVLISAIVEHYKRRCFRLWSQYYPYDPDQEYTWTHFQQKAAH